MKTVFLIGNGFDINLGLKTSYNYFYNYYINLPRDRDHNLVQELKSYITEYINGENNNWSDLEIGMGNHTTKLNNFEDVEIVYDDINESIQNYVTEIDEAFNEKIEEFDFNLLRTNILKFNSFLTPAESSFVRSNAKSTSDYHTIDIISFNYTATIEKLLKIGSEPLEIGRAFYNSNIKSILNNIIHIHGSVDDPILGVNDKTQIANENLREDIRVQNYLIKPLMNQSLRHLNDNKTKEIINNSHLICLYGLSLGDTDKTWWELIGKRLLDGVMLILFVYDKDTKRIPARKNEIRRRDWQDKFMNIANIPKESFEKVRNRIMITFNSPIFDIRKESI